MKAIILFLVIGCVLLATNIQDHAVVAACAEKPDCKGILCGVPKCDPPMVLKSDDCNCCPYCANP
nr:unnamed protein product [Callosobruchus analis]